LMRVFSVFWGVFEGMIRKTRIFGNKLQFFEKFEKFSACFWEKQSEESRDRSNRPQKLNSFFALLTVPLGFLVAQKILLFLLSTLICSELFFVQQKLIGLLSTLHDFVRCPFNDFVYRTLLTVPLGFFVAQKILPCLPFIFNMLRVVFCPTKYLKATVNTKTIFCTRI
jgi:hypothetical protein